MNHTFFLFWMCYLYFLGDNIGSAFFTPLISLSQSLNPTAASHSLFGNTNHLSSALFAKIALTREEEKNGKLKNILEKEGLDVVELPCICHARGDDFAKLVPALSIADQFDYITITSPEAATVFLSAWEQAGKPEGLTVASVGMATSKVLSAGGITPNFEPSKATAATIVAELPPKGKNRVLYPASAKAKKTLEDGLTNRGFTVTRLNTYTTLPAEWSEDMYALANDVDIVTFASPTAVKTWTERVGTSKPVACIGETSADACKSQGFQQIFYADKPGMPGWVQAVKDAMKESATAAVSQ